MPFTDARIVTRRAKTGAPRSKMIGPAVGSWQFDMVVYWQWRDHPESGAGASAWTSLRMTPDNAKKALIDD